MQLVLFLERKSNEREVRGTVEQLVWPLSISHTLEHSKMFKSFLSKLVGSKKEKSGDVFFR